MIKLRKTECGDSLMQTSDGQWLTNGHWMIRRHLCKTLKSAPALNPEWQPDYDLWRRGGPKLSEYRPAERSWITVQGQEALTVDGKITVWADPMYLDLLDNLGAMAYCAGLLEPIVFAIGALSDPAIVAWLMPMRQLLNNYNNYNRAKLAEWLREDK